MFALLEHHKVALCLHDMPGSATGKMAVGPFIYVRFHVGERQYAGAYAVRLRERIRHTRVA